MAEENKNAAPDQEFNDDGSKNPDYVAPTGGEGGDADPDKKDGDDSDGGDGDNSNDSDKDEFDDESEPNVPVRNSAASHIIARKNKKIKKLESKQDEGDGGDSGSDDADDDNELSSEAQSAVDDAIDKKVKPIKDKMASDADEAELKTLLRDEPDSKKYEKHIRAYMEHESYKGVPPSVIYRNLAFDHAQAIGAKKKEAADAEADGNKGGGRDVKPDTIGTDGVPTSQQIENMSDEDFEKLEQDARQGKFVKK